MKVYIKLSILLCCCLVFKNGYSQIYLLVDQGSNKVVVNTEHLITVKVLNVPKGAHLKVWVNKDLVETKNGEVTLIYTDSIISYHIVEIEVEVEVNHKIIFKEFKSLEFFYYKPNIAIQLNGSNYFYRGLDTDFKLTVAGFPNADVIVTCFGFTLRKLNDCDYRAYVNTTQNELKMGVSIKYSEDSVLKLGSNYFKVYDLPIPNFKLSRELDSVLLSDTVIDIRTITPPDLVGRVKPRIEKLTVQIWSSTGVQNFTCNGSEIKGELLEAIKKMKSGDLLYFKNIQFKWHDKQTNSMLINTVAFSKN